MSCVMQHLIQNEGNIPLLWGKTAEIESRASAYRLPLSLSGTVPAWPFKVKEQRLRWLFAASRISASHAGHAEMVNHFEVDAQRWRKLHCHVLSSVDTPAQASKWESEV